MYTIWAVVESGLRTRGTAGGETIIHCWTSCVNKWPIDVLQRVEWALFLAPVSRTTSYNNIHISTSLYAAPLPAPHTSLPLHRVN